MDALRYSKKIILLAVAILFLFTFFNLILDAPRYMYSSSLFISHMSGYLFEQKHVPRRKHCNVCLFAHPTIRTN